MPKGKKFDAAEKHFQKEAASYNRTIKYMREELNSFKILNAQLLAENSRLESDNDRLQQWVDRLLEYTELSRADIKAVCEQDKKRGQFIASLEELMKGYI